MKKCPICLPSVPVLLASIFIAVSGCVKRGSDCLVFEQPVMVHVPGGSLSVDSKGRKVDVSIGELWISRGEIITSQYVLFLNDISYAMPKASVHGDLHFGDRTIKIGMNGFGPGLERIFVMEGDGSNIIREKGRFYPVKGKEGLPVEGATFFGAQAYCEWLSKRTGRLYRLPWEVEWQFAAEKCGGAVLGMPGGPWEWCLDVFSDAGMQAPMGREPQKSTGECKRVVRGGEWVSAISTDSWASPAKRAAVEARSFDQEIPYVPALYPGFRVVSTKAPSAFEKDHSSPGVVFRQ